MRKIEQQMNQAISNNETWQSANTSVHYSAEYNSSTVYLHDNLIAIVGENDVEIFDGGWQTSTTKSRLNAILQEHAIDGEKVFQKAGDWFVKQYNNLKKDWEVVPFQSGMVVGG